MKIFVASYEPPFCEHTLLVACIAFVFALMRPDKKMSPINQWKKLFSKSVPWWIPFPTLKNSSRVSFFFFFYCHLKNEFGLMERQRERDSNSPVRCHYNEVIIRGAGVACLPFSHSEQLSHTVMICWVCRPYERVCMRRCHNASAWENCYCEKIWKIKSKFSPPNDVWSTYSCLSGAESLNDFLTGWNDCLGMTPVCRSD